MFVKRYDKRDFILLFMRNKMWLWTFKLLLILEILFAGSIVAVSSASATGNKKGICKKLKFTERINQDNHEVSSIVGSDFKFDCRVIGTPEPNITWTKDDMPLKAVSYRSFGSGGLEKVFVLNLKNLLVADSGRYKCTAYNGDCKAISTSLKLIIKEDSPREAPSIKELLPVNPKIKVGENVKFSCFVRKVEDVTPFIKWVKYTTYKMRKIAHAVLNNTNVTTTPLSMLQKLTRRITPEKEQTLNVERLATTKYVIDGIVHQTTDLKIEKCLRSELVISSASFEDSGDYSCVAFNEIGFDTVKSRLEVKKEPPLSKEELERIYMQKYGTHIKLPFSLAAVVVIPVCLLIILIIGCVWWHSNEQRLEEERLKIEKQKYVESVTEEKKKVHPRMVPIVSIQSTTSDSVDNGRSSYNFARRIKANSDAGVHTPVALKKFQPKEASFQSLSKKGSKSANINESDDKAKLLVEDHHEDSDIISEDVNDNNVNSDEGNHPLA